MKSVSFFFITLTISTFCWNGISGLVYYKDTTTELTDFAKGKLNDTCFKATATILEVLHDIKEKHWYRLDEGECFAHYKDGLQLMYYARKHFHNTNNVLENLQSCRDFVERAQKQESIYETMENMKNNKKGQDNHCSYNVKMFHDELKNYFAYMLRQLRYVEKGKYFDIAFEKLFYGIQWIKPYI